MFNYRIVIAQAELLKSIIEAQGKNYLDFSEKINSFESSFKQLAAWMIARDAEDAILNDVIKRHLKQYVDAKQLSINDIRANAEFAFIKGEKFPDIESLINFVHGEFPIAYADTDEKVKTEDLDLRPILTGDGIQIFQVNNIHESRKLAKGTSWCIGYPGPNNMWPSYRRNLASTFFIVFDENPSHPSQARIALDYNMRENQITDLNNRTATHLTSAVKYILDGEEKIGSDFIHYIEYLKSKNVPIDAKVQNPETGKEEPLLKNKPKTPEEVVYGDIYKFRNGNDAAKLTPQDIRDFSKGILTLKTDTRRFKIDPEKPEEIGVEFPRKGVTYNINLEGLVKIINKVPSKLEDNYTSVTLQSDLFKDYLSIAITSGEQLTDQTFNYVLTLPGSKEILIQYVNTGISMSNYQVDKIAEMSKSLLKSYVRQQVNALDQGFIMSMNFYFTKFLEPNDITAAKGLIKILDKIPTSFDKFDNVINPEFLSAFPQIELAAEKFPQTDNPEVNKILLGIYGPTRYYQDNPTVENTRVLLKTKEGMQDIRNIIASSDLYTKNLETRVRGSAERLVFLESAMRYVPSEIFDLPEFQIYKSVPKAKEIKDTGKFEFNPKELTTQDFQSLALAEILSRNPIRTNVYNMPEFWDYVVNNFENIIDVLRSSDLIDYYKINIFQSVGYSIDKKELFKKIFEKLNLDIKQLFQVMSYLSFDISTITQSLADLNIVNSFTELKNLPIDEERYSKIVSSDNPLMRKLLEISDGDMIIWGIQHGTPYENLQTFLKIYSWYPELINKITANVIFKLLNNFRYHTSDLDRFFDILEKRKPELLDYISSIPGFALYSQFSNVPIEIRIALYNRIGKINQQKAEQQQAENPQIQEQPEENNPDKIAKINALIKIARKLDQTKKYSLADKFTNILRKYNV
jgi:hypothetical protein